MGAIRGMAAIHEGQVIAYLEEATAGLLVAALLFGAIQRLEVEHLRRINAELVAGVEKLKDANGQQRTTISLLEGANRQWAGRAQKQYDAYTQALADLTRANVARDALDAKLRALEGKDKASAQCTAVLDLDLAGPCPGIAEAIKERAR